MSQHRPLDVVWADILNGAVVTVLGLIFPTLCVWAIVRVSGEPFEPWLMTERRFLQGVQAVFLIGASLMAVRWGLRVVARSVAELRHRDVARRDD